MSFATKLDGCRYERAGPCCVLRFRHPSTFRGFSLVGLEADCPRPTYSLRLRQCQIAMVGASGRANAASVRDVPVVVYADERKRLIGMLFLETQTLVDFRDILGCR